MKFEYDEKSENKNKIENLLGNAANCEKEVEYDKIGCGFGGYNFGCVFGGYVKIVR